MKNKILITGLGRHGKDTLCEILKDKYGLKFSSSSWTAANLFIFDALKESHGYKTVQECFDDRHSDDNRKIWYDLICEFNKHDKARLAKIILSENDIYCGLRSKEELDECNRQGLFLYTFWVNASERVGVTEDESSIDVKESDCDLVINNNGSKSDLYDDAETIFHLINFV